MKQRWRNFARRFWIGQVNLYRLGSLFWREFRELLNDRLTLALLILLPTLMLFTFTYAITTEISNYPLAVVDNDRTELSRGLISGIGATNAFEIIDCPTQEQALEDLGGGEIGAALILPPGFSESIQAGETGIAQLLTDGVDPVVARTARAYISGSVSLIARDIQTGQGVRPPTANIEVDIRPLFNPQLRSEPFMIPGILGYLTTFLTVVVMSLSIVRERENGTFEGMMVTPITPWEVILGKVMPMALVSLIVSMLIITLGWIAFGVAPQGSPLLILIVVLVYLHCCMAYGLLISNKARTSSEAVQLTVLVVIPQLQLSGFIFPVEALGTPFQYLAELIPLTHFNRIIRAVYLSGADMSHIWLEFLIMLVLMAFFFTLAARSIRRQAL